MSNPLELLQNYVQEIKKMKKLLGIIVLGLLLSGNAYAKDVKLICNGIKDDGISHVVIINDKKK